MENISLKRFSALGHPQRLAIFRLLMRRHPDRLPAGEIAAALQLPASTLSAYLATLMQAGLVTQHRAGTSLQYGIDMPEVRATLDYLMNDCCRGRPDLCAPALRPEQASARRRNVLFICTANSARSILAEAILRAEGGARFNAYSAGTRPNSVLNPATLTTLAVNGYDSTGLHAKNLGSFQTPDAPRMDFIFTVCDQAANEECPAWPGQPVTAHWGVPDPVAVRGTPAETARAFQAAHDQLRARILAFVALPLATLDAIALQGALDGIALQPDGPSP